MVGSEDSETFGRGFDSRHLQWAPAEKPIFLPHPMAAYLKANQSTTMMTTLTMVEMLMLKLMFKSWLLNVL